MGGQVANRVTAREHKNRRRVTDRSYLSIVTVPIREANRRHRQRDPEIRDSPRKSVTFDDFDLRRMAGNQQAKRTGIEQPQAIGEQRPQVALQSPGLASWPVSVGRGVQYDRVVRPLATNLAGRELRRVID